MTNLLALSALGLITLGAAGAAHADKIACSPEAKKLEWHVCVIDHVEYKRGMKTETRDECKTDKVIKVPDGCNFGDLGQYIPAGASSELVKFYAIAPAGFDEAPWESQGEPAVGQCSLHTANDLAGWELMKFSEAFDKDNRERSEIVKDKLKKQKKVLSNFGVWAAGAADECGGKSAKVGLLDRKSLSKFLVYAEYKFPAK